MKKLLLILIFVPTVAHAAREGIDPMTASALLPIRAGVISYSDVVRACAANDPATVGWEYRHTFAQTCENIRFSS